jgi:hypothetical protein
MDGTPRRAWYSATQHAARGCFECLDADGRSVIVTLVLGLDEPEASGGDYVDVGVVTRFVRHVPFGSDDRSLACSPERRDGDGGGVESGDDTGSGCDGYPPMRL